MATNNRTAEILLKYTVDTASANRVRQSFTALEYELGDLRAELLGVGTSAQQGVTNLRQRFAQGETAIESMQGEVEQLRRDLLALDNVTVTPTVEVAGAGGSGIRGNAALNTVDRFGRFGTQVSGAFGQAGGLGNAVGLIGDVADSFGTLGVMGGVATVAMGAVSLALKDIADRAAAAAEAQTRLIEGERAGEAQASDEVQARIDRIAEIIELVKVEQASIEERRQEIIDLQTQYANAVGLNGDLLAQFRAGSDLSGQIQALETNISNSENTVAGLSAEFIELNSHMNTTKAEVGDFIDKTAAALDDALKASKGVKGAGLAIQGGIGSGMTSFASIRAQMDVDLLSTRTGAYMEAVTQTVHAQEALTKAQNAYNEAVTASAGRISEINAKLQSDLTAAETDRQTDLADAAREAGDQRIKIEEETGKERQRIQKRFERSYNDAVAERDALAAKRAEDQRDDELDQLGDRYKEQLKTVDDSLKKQQAVIDARYKAQVATANAAAQAAVRTEQQAAQARITVLQQGVQAAQVALVNAQQNEYLTRANFYNQSLSQAQVWANLMQLYTSYGFSIPAGAGTGGGIGGRTLPTPLASGGPMTAGQSYWVGEQGPEMVTPTRPGYVNPAGTGCNINLNLSGATTETIRAVSRQQALATFGRVLDQMGVA